MINAKQKKIILKTAKYAQKTLGRDATGHDWMHVRRVWKNARLIGKTAKANMFIVELAALLHDIADWKFHAGDNSIGVNKAIKWLQGLRVDSKDIAQVAAIIEQASFKGAQVKNTVRTLEGQVVQDADRLDAIGAIGVARAFAYGGAKGREIYNPRRKPILHASAQSYSKNTSPTINHFYEKLLLVKNLMNTKTGKRMARSRHKFMEAFLRRFFFEVNGR
ncbi:MAG: HD domain-containing protein [Elusimicrobia bacterium]|nr:HD domain-containing protein [Elusimicrobiota bacterium]